MASGEIIGIRKGKRAEPKDEKQRAATLIFILRFLVRWNKEASSRLKLMFIS